ncbi:MAG: endo-1,4-beta-xylanase [Bacteroidales bacterium]|nr:endo-1,4-beta-xylanase [Bacteroidales bacterium]
MGMIIKIRRLVRTVLLFIVMANPIASLKAQDVKNTETAMLKRAEENIEKYRKGDVRIMFKTSDGKLLKNASVEVHQMTHDFLFGCIIFDLVGGEDPYKPELFKEQFRKIFNLAVFPFYWADYEAKQGETRWAAMPEVLNWCKANGITTKGHPLVWATKPGTPEWLADYTEKETEEFLKTRVQNITAGFRGKIELFDVVNEPIHVRTWKHKMEHFADTNDWDVSDTLSQIADYVETSLRWAHQGNPRATLMINEYKTLADAGDRKIRGSAYRAKEEECPT